MQSGCFINKLHCATFWYYCLVIFSRITSVNKHCHILTELPCNIRELRTSWYFYWCMSPPSETVRQTKPQSHWCFHSGKHCQLQCFELSVGFLPRQPSSRAQEDLAQTKQKQTKSLSAAGWVAHPCPPSHSGGWCRRIPSVRSSRQFKQTLSRIKRAGQVASCGWALA